ncbi:MAG: alanine racemase [Pseudomonadota bacterium]
MTTEQLAGGRLTIDLDAIVRNWKMMDGLSRPGWAAAVVKADAYSLGATAIAPALQKAGCGTFFVALPEEGFSLRSVLPDQDVRIFCFNGMEGSTGKELIYHRVFPVISEHKTLEKWCSAWHDHSGNEPIPLALMFDTGMTRLGFDWDGNTNGQPVLERSPGAKMPSSANVICMSHYACADDPSHKKNDEQHDRFVHVICGTDLRGDKNGELKGSVLPSMSNSAALVGGARKVSDTVGPELSRPGIALYGGEACDPNQVTNPAQNPIRLEARIVQVRKPQQGETVSYGGTHTVGRDMKIAVVSVGYADGYPRAGSGSGTALREAGSMGMFGFIAGKRVPVVGRVTMDLTMFNVTDVDDKDLDGGWIELIGDNVPLDQVARASGTIGYEILTSIGPRYARNYVGGEAIEPDPERPRPPDFPILRL